MENLNNQHLKTAFNVGLGIQIDLASSALGLLAQTGTFFYLFNRRI